MKIRQHTKTVEFHTHTHRHTHTHTHTTIDRGGDYRKNLQIYLKTALGASISY